MPEGQEKLAWATGRPTNKTEDAVCGNAVPAFWDVRGAVPYKALRFHSNDFVYLTGKNSIRGALTPFRKNALMVSQASTSLLI